MYNTNELHKNTKQKPNKQTNKGHERIHTV